MQEHARTRRHQITCKDSPRVSGSLKKSGVTHSEARDLKDASGGWGGLASEGLGAWDSQFFKRPPGQPGPRG